MFGRKHNSAVLNVPISHKNDLPSNPGEPALIVDLPDGQKLIVGEIEAGTVIEVATWRGTGRPDSRTNRMLLGAGVSENARTKAIAAPKSNKNDSVFTVKPEPRGLANKINTNNKKVIKGNHGVSRKSKSFQRVGFVAAGITAVLSIPMLLVNNGLFQFTSPDLGLATKLGRADSVYAITTAATELQSGDIVISTITGKNGSQELMAQVLVYGANSVLLQANGFQYEVSRETITSKVRVVVPFAGSFARIIQSQI